MTPRAAVDFLFDPQTQLASIDGSHTLGVVGNLTYLSEQLFSTSPFKTSVLKTLDGALILHTTGIVPAFSCSMVLLVRIPGFHTSSVQDQPLLLFRSPAVERQLTQEMRAQLGLNLTNVNDTACAIPSGLYLYIKKLLLTPVDVPVERVNTTTNSTVMPQGPRDIFWHTAESSRNKRKLYRRSGPIAQHPRAYSLGNSSNSSVCSVAPYLGQ
jgi:hypothetical protein